jgi:hypothetical protein
MKKNLILLPAALACGLFMSACVTIGQSFDTVAVAKIVIGKTTQSGVKAMFGAPFRTGVDSGDPTWTYVDYHFGVFSKQQTTDLFVKFSADGTVKSYAFNTTQEDADKK